MASDDTPDPHFPCPKCGAPTYSGWRKRNSQGQSEHWRECSECLWNIESPSLGVLARLYEEAIAANA